MPFVFRLVLLVLLVFLPDLLPRSSGLRLEIQTSTESKPPAPLRICEAPKVWRVDVQIEEKRIVLSISIRVVAEIGMVQHVDYIDADFKLFSFRDSHALNQIRVQSEMRRALDPAEAKAADLSGSRIDEKEPALRIRYRLVAELTVQTLQ